MFTEDDCYPFTNLEGESWSKKCGDGYNIEYISHIFMRLGAAGLVSAREEVVVVLSEDGSVLGVEFILILEEALVEYLVEPVPRPDLVPVKNGKCDMYGENGELWHMRKRKKGLA